MDNESEYKKEFRIMSLKFGSPIVLGIISLLTSSLLQVLNAFPKAPSLIFKIINGVSIALILVFGFIWSQMEKKLQSKYKKSTEE